MLSLARAKVRLMEYSYWIGRKRASAANARGAACSSARLVHLDLAGRYSVLAAAAVAANPRSAQSPAQLPLADARYYERLEVGARWLASRSASEGERHEHLGFANRYARLRLEAAQEIAHG